MLRSGRGERRAPVMRRKQGPLGGCAEEGAATLPVFCSVPMTNSTGSPSARLRKPEAWMLRWWTNTCRTRQSGGSTSHSAAHAGTSALACDPAARRRLQGSRHGQAARVALLTHCAHIPLLPIDGDEAEALDVVPPFAGPGHQLRPCGAQAPGPERRSELRRRCERGHTLPEAGKHAAGGRAGLAADGRQRPSGFRLCGAHSGHWCPCIEGLVHSNSLESTPPMCIRRCTAT